MTADFGANVEAAVGPLLRELGFKRSAVDDGPDEGGIPRQIVFYRSPDCKLQIYRSSREGETNCMIAPLTAPNRFGLNEPDWHFISRFSKRSDISPQERLRIAIAEAKAYEDQLDWVRDRIAQHYETAHAAILQKYPAQ